MLPFKQLANGVSIACGKLGYPMLRRAPKESHGIRSCIIFMAAAVVLFTPVQSAGSEGFSHPHAMVQMIAEALHLTPHHHHTHAEHSGAAGNSDNVVLRADHPDNQHVGDNPVADTTRADAPVLTKVSLTLIAYVPALLPPLLAVVYPVRLFAVLAGASEVSRAGRTIQPDFPPPRLLTWEL